MKNNEFLGVECGGGRTAHAVGLVTSAQRLSPTFFLLQFMGFAHDVLTPTISNSGGWGLWHLFPTHTHTHTSLWHLFPTHTHTHTHTSPNAEVAECSEQVPSGASSARGSWPGVGGADVKCVKLDAGGAGKVDIYLDLRPTSSPVLGLTSGRLAPGGTTFLYKSYACAMALHAPAMARRQAFFPAPTEAASRNRACSGSRAYGSPQAAGAQLQLSLVR